MYTVTVRIHKIDERIYTTKMQENFTDTQQLVFFYFILRENYIMRSEDSIHIIPLYIACRCTYRICYQ